MKCETCPELHKNQQSNHEFYNPNVITLHTGNFGINMVEYLYPPTRLVESTADLDFMPKPILCDLDSESINRI